MQERCSSDVIKAKASSLKAKAWTFEAKATGAKAIRPDIFNISRPHCDVVNTAKGCAQQ